MFTSKCLSSKGFETTGPKEVISPLVYIESHHCVSDSFEYMQFIHSFIPSFLHSFILEDLLGSCCFGPVIYLTSGSLDSESVVFLLASWLAEVLAGLEVFGGERMSDGGLFSWACQDGLLVLSISSPRTNMCHF